MSSAFKSFECIVLYSINDICNLIGTLLLNESITELMVHHYVPCHTTTMGPNEMSSCGLSWQCGCGCFHVHNSMS